MIDLFRPFRDPEGADNGPLAFVWEQLGNQEDCWGASGRSSTSIEAVAGSAQNASQGPPARLVPLGTQLHLVEAVAEEKFRGIRISWTKGPGPAAEAASSGASSQELALPCPDPASLPAEALAGVSLLLLCDPTAPWPTPAARQDAAGEVHLDRLKLARTQARQKSCAGKQPMLSLEWPSLMACPACRLADYAPQPGKCRGDQTRSITFVRVRPCLGGAMPPPGYEEDCETGGLSVTSVASKVVPRRYAWRATLFVIVALLLGCVLALYAAHLHRRYRPQFLADGGL